MPVLCGAPPNHGLAAYAMKIPIFVSCPTKLNPQQEKSRALLVNLLDDFGLDARALGRSDYPTDYPLREVYVIAKHCSGGVILGFEQFRATEGSWKRGTKEERGLDKPACFPTPWNHLEAGILFGMKLPLMIFREKGVTGGVFDNGVSDLFIHNTPDGDLPESEMTQLREVILKWRGRVSEHYHSY